MLALQGAFREHVEVLDALGVDAVEVRTPGRPRRASTRWSCPAASRPRCRKLLDVVGPVRAAGRAARRRHAGARHLRRDDPARRARSLDGRPDQRRFGAIDIAVRRNAYGRQVDSFEADLDVDGLAGGAVPARVHPGARASSGSGDGVEVLAAVDGHPVLCRQGPVMVAAFHPELRATCGSTSCSSRR